MLQLGYELLLSEMQEKLGGHRLRFEDKISERPPYFMKYRSSFNTRYGSNVCMSKHNANESLEQSFLRQFLYEWVY